MSIDDTPGIQEAPSMDLEGVGDVGDKRRVNRLALAVGGVVLAVGSLMIGVEIGGSSENSDVIAGSEAATATTLVEVESPVQTTLIGNKSESVDASSNMDHLPISELIKRSAFAKADELVAASNEVATATSIQTILDDWTYKFALYINSGYGDPKTVDSLIANVDSASWEGFGQNMVRYSGDVSDDRRLKKNIGRWEFFDFTIYEITTLSPDRFKFTGELHEDSTQPGHQQAVEGKFTFTKDTFTVYGKQYTGWRITRDQ